MFKISGGEAEHVGGEASPPPPPLDETLAMFEGLMVIASCIHDTPQ